MNKCRCPSLQAFGKGGSLLCTGPICPCGVQPSSCFSAAGLCTLLHPAAPPPDKAPPKTVQLGAPPPSSYVGCAPKPALQLGSVYPLTSCRSFFCLMLAFSSWSRAKMWADSIRSWSLLAYSLPGGTAGVSGGLPKATSTGVLNSFPNMRRAGMHEVDS